MRQLRKRWGPLKKIPTSPLYRAFLSESGNDGPYWGCIEALSLDGPFRLEIWDGLTNEWEFVETFPTFEEAKEVGRLLAGVSLNTNI